MPNDDPENLPTLEIDWENDDNDVDIEASAAQLELFQRKVANRTRIHKEYPFLNEKQLEFVGTLDDAIDNAMPQVRLPKLRIVRQSSDNQEVTWSEYLSLLIAPCLIFMVTLPAAIAIAVLLVDDDSDSNIATTIQSLYPYLITLVTFLASVPVIRNRYYGYFEKISTGVDAAKERVDPAVDKLEGRLTGVVKEARRQLDTFLVTIKEKLKQLSQAKKTIELVVTDSSDTLRMIPDVSDLDGYLDDSERRIHESIRTARAAVDVKELVPWVLQTRRNYALGVVFPILTVMLAIQFVATWWLSIVEEGDEDDANKWEPVMVAVQTFVIAVLQITLSYYVTRATRIVGYVNRKIGTIEKRINAMLANKAHDAFHSVLDAAMTHVRRRVLEVVARVRKLERLAVGVKEKAHGVQGMASTATATMVQLEETLESNHVASEWMEKVSAFFSQLVRQIDDCTAGLVDCTGFVEEDEAKSKTSKVV